MMITYKEIFRLFLLAHVLSDFYFQTEAMAAKKENDFKYIVIHSLVYGAAALITVNLFADHLDAVYLWGIIISHFVIDAAKYALKKKGILRTDQKYIFIADQILHIAILMGVSYLMIKSGKTYAYHPMISDILNTMGMSVSAAVCLTVQLLLVHKPANIFIVKMAGSYKPNHQEDEETNKAGRMIGTIERIIMLFFLLIQQYASIGLVLTAKSIARYNKISEDKEFAEYYLLGTLLSTLCVLAVSLL